MMQLFASDDPKAELWVGKVEGQPIHAEAATLDDLLAKVWAMIRDSRPERTIAGETTEDRVEESQLIVVVDMGKGTRSLLETLHLMRSPANAKRLDDALRDIAAGKVIKRDL